MGLKSTVNGMRERDTDGFAGMETPEEAMHEVSSVLI